MPSSNQHKVLIGCLLTGLLVLTLITAYALTRSQRDIPRAEATADNTKAAGFSFYGIHHDTVLNRRLRQTLAEQLGRDGISRRGPIDLIIIDPAFTRSHFPEIHNYHMALNPPFGGRREHAITQLTYRRAQQQGIPFRLIRLVFSQATGKPLYLVVEPSDDGPGIFETLQTKYGLPVTRDGVNDGDQALIWEKPDEILAGVSIRRRGGRVDRQVRFYFLANIGDLVAREQDVAEAQRRQTDKAKRSAF